MENENNLPSERNKRFEGLYRDTIGKFTESEHVLTGVGAVGGYIGRILCQIGVKRLHLWDHDTIEEVNLGPQGFAFSEIGKPKVLSRANEFAGINPDVEIISHQKKFHAKFEHPQNAYWWICVDSISARDFIAQNAIIHCPEKIIDTRMGGPSYEIYCASNDYNKYCETLSFARENPVLDGCTTKSTPHCAMTAAAIGINMALSAISPFSVKGDMLSYSQTSEW